MTFHRLLIGSSLTALSLSVSPAQAEIVDVEDGGFSFTLGGQINRAFLFTDDGVESNEFFVDNDNSSTRLTARAAYSFGNYVVGALVEYEFEFSTSNGVSQLNSDISSSVSNERKFELFTNTPYGNFAYGQGDAASNGITEIDLSGTFIGNNSAVGLIAGGQIFRTTAGGFSGNTVGSLFSNFDGITRIERFRYDTPTFGGGFVVSASIGEDSQNDVALRYNGKFGDFRVRSGITYAQLDETDRIAGSVSAFHDPTGLNVTFASGSDDLNQTGREDPGFNYLKLGYQKKNLLPWGSTSFAVDYYDGTDQAVNDSSSQSYSFFAVQRIDRIDTEVYAGFRTFQAETATESFQDIDAVFIGARYRF